MNARTNTTTNFRNALTFVGAAALMACPAMGQNFVMAEAPVEIETKAEQPFGGKDGDEGGGSGGWVSPRVQMADYDQNSKVDAMDLYAFFIDWNAGKERADINGDGWLDAADVWYYLDVWQSVLAAQAGGKGSSK